MRPHGNQRIRGLASHGDDLVASHAFFGYVSLIGNTQFFDLRRGIRKIMVSFRSHIGNDVAEVSGRIESNVITADRDNFKLSLIRYCDSHR